MKILAIDTSTEACSVALSIEGEVQTRYEYAPRRHTELILPMIDALMSEAGLVAVQLDGLALGRGPGAFTGIRIATGIIQGIAFAADLPVAEISSIAALAQGSYRKHESQSVMAGIDARMNEVYWCCYQLELGLMTPCMEEGVYKAENVPLPKSPPEQNWQGAGTAWESYAEVLASRTSEFTSEIFPDSFPEAIDILQLALNKFEIGDVVSAELVSPVYLRDKIVS